MSRKGLWGWLTGSALGLFVLGAIIVIAIALAQQEPIDLTFSPCYAGFCLSGDSMDMRICLNGEIEKTVNVTIISEAFKDKKIIREVSYKECGDVETGLRADLAPQKYPVIVEVPIDTNVDVLLKLKRWLRSGLSPIEESDHYKKQTMFEPKFPEVKIVTRGVSCSKSDVALSVEEVGVYLEDDAKKSSYDCQLEVKTRRFVDLQHPDFKLDGESGIYSDDDSRSWSSGFQTINSVRQGTFLNIFIRANNNLDYVNPQFRAVCLVNNQSVIAHNSEKSVRCPQND